MPELAPDVYQNPIERRLTQVVGMSEAEHLLLEEASVTRLYRIGATATATYFRAHCGEPQGPQIFKGGTRVTNDSVDNLPSLAYDMLLKGDDNDLGGKAFIMPNRPIGHDEAAQKQVAVEYAQFMVEAGFAGHDRDIPGADAGFTAPLTDHYAQEYRRLVPDDPYWRASISSKSPEEGGLAGRLEATGRGVYATIHAYDDYLISGTPRDMGKRRSIVIEGMGAVGGATAMFAAQDDLGVGEQSRFRVTRVNDRFSTLRVVEDPYGEGMVVTQEMFESICANRTYGNGDKLVDLKRAMEANQPNLRTELVAGTQALFDGECDYFVPASTRKGSVNEDNIGKITEMIRFAQVEGANDVTTPGAAKEMTRRGVVRIADFIANQQGVMGSGDEVEGNIAQADAQRDGNVYVPPSKLETLARVDDRQISTMLDLFDLYSALRKEYKDHRLSLADAAKIRRLSRYAIARGIVSAGSVPDQIAA